MLKIPCLTFRKFCKLLTYPIYGVIPQSYNPSHSETNKNTDVDQHSINGIWNPSICFHQLCSWQGEVQPLWDMKQHTTHPTVLTSYTSTQVEPSFVIKEKTIQNVDLFQINNDMKSVTITQSFIKFSVPALHEYNKDLGLSSQKAFECWNKAYTFTLQVYVVIFWLNVRNINIYKFFCC